MRILFISDIHGVPSTLETALKMAEGLGWEKLVLLGDLLYHGPRNGVPNFYDPVKVAQILNPLADRIIAVRGNCDAEVDQMLLAFDIEKSAKVLEADGERMLLSHGHIYYPGCLPPEDYYGRITTLVNGHTHVPANEQLENGIRYFNPGSVSLPKGGSSRSFGFWDGERFMHYTI